MKNWRLVGMIGAGLVLALILFIGISVSGRSSPQNGSPLATQKIAASLTPVSFTQVSEAVSDGQSVLRLSGIAEPLSVIVLMDRGERIRQVRTSAQGIWSATLDIAGPGMAIEAVMFDPASGESTGVTDTGPPAGATSIRGLETIFRIQRVSEEQPGAIALIMISAPGAPSRIVQSPFGGLPSSGPLAIGAIDYDDQGGVIFSGISEISGRVQLSVANAIIGETRVGPDGRWTYIASSVMPLGEYDVKVELMDRNNATVSVPFERLPPLPETQGDDGALSVNFESFRWQIRRSLVGGGLQSTAIFAPDYPSAADVIPQAE